MAEKDLALMAHLLRRAGFGASRDELEARVAQGYDSVVEELLNPGDEPGIEVDKLFRHFPNFIEGADFAFAASELTYPDDQQQAPIAREDRSVLARPPLFGRQQGVQRTEQRPPN